MTIATALDKSFVIDILSAAFDSNKSVNYIVRRDNNQKDRIRALMDYSFEICLKFGQVFISNDKHACALILFPEKKKTTFGSIWLDIRLIFQAIGINGIYKTLKREAAIKQIQPEVAMCYLWFIGVNPEYQHHGSGTALLREILTWAAELRRPVYLETSTERNLPWYRSMGFEVYDQLDLSYNLYFLRQI